MKASEAKKNKVSYYTGWGVDYGVFTSRMMGVVFKEYALSYLVGASIGTAFGTIYGKKKLGK